MTTRTTCPYCGVGCGVLVTPEAQGWSVAGDPEHPANFGRLCSKGSALAQAIELPDRLLAPRMDGTDVSWDQALDGIVRGFARTIADHGPDSVAFYVSGQILTEDYYVANKLMKGFIGSANIDTNSRLCMASSVAGHRRAFGSDTVPGLYEDWELADLVVLVGSNTAWCHPVLYQRLVAARKQRGTKIVVIDPRRTATCDDADLHLALRPGSDVALFAGLLRHLAEAGATKPLWLGTQTEGYEATLAASPGIEDVAAITGLAVAELQAFYRLFTATERTVTAYSQGVNQSSSGTDKVNAIINCHLATARIGRPGMGPFSVTGQPNAMGGREVGGLANQLAAHMGFGAEDRDRVARFWKAPALAAREGAKAVDMFDAVADGRIKAIWIMGTNPAVSMPNAGKVRAALSTCPLVVVSDCVETDTTGFAHILLPAATWGEKDGTVTNSERRISRQRPFRAAPGEARADWWMMAEVARRLGFADAFPYGSPAEIFREHAELSAFENEGRRDFDLSDLIEADYESLAPSLWPHGRKRLFGDGRFFTPDRRARLVPVAWRPPVHAPATARPFRLNSGRLRDQWHTMTRTGAVERLMTHRPEPLLSLHPGDAAALGLASGDLVAVESDWGRALLKADPSDDVTPGDVFVPMHWTDRFASLAGIGAIVNPATDPISGQPELKHTPVSLAKVESSWRGFLLTRTETAIPDGVWWSRRPLNGAMLYELAGLDASAPAEKLAPLLRGDLVSVADAARGAYRWAAIAEERLEFCLFVTRDGSLPARDALASLFDEVALSDEDRFALLSGARRGEVSDAGPVVCSCFRVSARAILDAIAERRLSTVEEIGAALRAGTNCGSCLPELRGLLTTALTPHAA